MSGFRYRPFQTQPRRFSSMILGRGFATNTAPTISVPSAQTGVISNVAYSITGISISDPESNNQTVSLSVSHGTLTLASLTGLTGSGNGTSSLSYSGTLANILTALAAVSYTSTTDYQGSDTLTINSTDSAGGAATQKTVAITVTWTPASESSLVGWWSGDSITKFFTDDGVTQAAIGDPVKRWYSDNSGSLYFVQATLANRPILRQGANGKYFVSGESGTTYMSVTQSFAAPDSFVISARRNSGDVNFARIIRPRSTNSLKYLCWGSSGNTTRIIHASENGTGALENDYDIESGSVFNFATYSFAWGGNASTNLLRKYGLTGQSKSGETDVTNDTSWDIGPQSAGSRYSISSVLHFNSSINSTKRALAEAYVNARLPT